MFYPEQLPENYKYNFTTEFDELNFDLEDGSRINALLFKSDSPKGLIIYFHGNAGSLRGWGSVASEFTVLNYDLLIYDYPGFGKSRGELSEKGLFRDAQFLYDEFKTKYAHNSIILYGRSMGTGIAAYIASQNNPALLILETPYYSGRDLAHKLYPWLPTFLTKFPFRTDLFLPNVKCPVYIFHGTEDEVVYYGSSLKLRKLFKEGDTLFTIEGGHHNDLNSFTEYHQWLTRILTAN
ncbi:alpha/beta hydrolase [Bacteroidota bacterium]